MKGGGGERGTPTLPLSVILNFNSDYQNTEYRQLRPKSGSGHTAVQCTVHAVHVYVCKQVSVYSSYSLISFQRMVQFVQQFNNMAADIQLILNQTTL